MLSAPARGNSVCRPSRASARAESGDAEQEYFSDGLTEELLNLLAKIPELKVAARTSSFYYKDRMHDIPFREIGRQLEVAHLLEGSVRKGGNQIRITAQLIKAEDGFHLWSETWDRTLDDVFAIQDEIAASVSEQLRITLLGEAPHARVIDTQSWELTLQARYFFNRRWDGDLVVPGPEPAQPVRRDLLQPGVPVRSGGQRVRLDGDQRRHRRDGVLSGRSGPRAHVPGLPDSCAGRRAGGDPALRWGLQGPNLLARLAPRAAGVIPSVIQEIHIQLQQLKRPHDQA